MHKNLMMVGAFSHSTAVGKLRKDLPDVPMDVRINFPRYNLDEAATVCHYYVRLLPKLLFTTLPFFLCLSPNSNYSGKNLAVCLNFKRGIISMSS